MADSIKDYGRALKNVGGFKHLTRFARPTGPFGEYLKLYAWRDVERLYDGFTGNAIVTTTWTTNAGTGATAFAVPGTPVQTGVVQAATGTNATASNRAVNFYGAPVWSGTKNAGIEVRFQFSAVTSLQFEVGFIDTMTSITTAAPAVTDIDTPAFAAGLGDAAVVAMDTSQTLTTMGLVVKNSNAATSSKTAIGTLAPSATTDMTIRVQLIANDVFATIDDATTNYTTSTALTGIYGTTLVRPWVYVGSPTNNTSKTMNLDYVHCWQDR